MRWFKKHKVLTVILALVVIVIVSVSVSGSGEQTDATSNSGVSAKSDAQTVAKIGEPTRDGKFEFVVKNIECGQKEVVSPDSDLLRQTAQGVFCLVDLSVKNIGDEQQYFVDSEQKLLNAEGQQFAPDSTATLYYGDQDVWLAQINPGNGVEGTLVFDVPEGTTVTQAELHDSAFSGGVKVDLR